MKRINDESEDRVPSGEWITVEEAAKLSSKSIKTIYRQIKAGRLSKMEDYTVRGGRKYLVRRDEVEALSRPMYALERVKARDSAIERQEHALTIIMDTQKSIEDVIENSRTNIRKMSRLLYLLIITGLFIAGWIFFSNRITVSKIEGIISILDSERTYMSTYVQAQLDTQRKKLEAYSQRIDELELELKDLRKSKEKKRRKRFLGIF